MHLYHVASAKTRHIVCSHFFQVFFVFLVYVFSMIFQIILKNFMFCVAIISNYSS